MGAVLGCLSGQALTCVTGAACTCCGSLLNQIKFKGSVSTRFAYAGIFMSNSLLAWIMTTNWGIEKIKYITYGFVNLKCPENVCYGIMAVHRVCFAQALWHVILGALVYGVNYSQERRAKIQNGYWGFKWFGLLALIILSFFIPNEFYRVYGTYLAPIGAAISIFIQLVLLVDFAHNIAEYCIERYEETYNDNWKYVLIGGTLTSYLVFMGLMITQYVMFGKSGCGLNQLFITANAIICLLASFVAINPKVQEVNFKSGLAQSAMVSIYATYLVTSALIGLPVGGKIPSQCNPLIENSGTRTTLIVFGAIFTMAAICYSTSTAATNSGSLINPSEYGPIRLIDNSLLMEDSGVSESELRNRAVNDAVASGALPSAAVMDMPESPSGLNNGGNGDEQESEDDEKHGVIYNYSFFHFIFCVAAMYMAMLLTNWNSIDANSGDFIIIGRSMAAVWVKVVSSWACVALYVWTLVAPVVLSDSFILLRVYKSACKPANDKDLRFKEQVIKTIEDSVANTKTGVNNRIGLENKIDEIFERRGTWDHLQREIKMRIKSDKEMFERINGRIHENIQKTGDKEGVEFSNRMDIKSLKSNGRNKNSKDLGILFEGNVVVAMLELSQLTGVQHPKVYSANGSVSDQNTRALTTVQIVRVDLGANSCLVRRIVGEEDQGSEGLYTVGFRDLIKLGMDLGNGTKTSPIERGSKVYFLNYEYQKIEKEQKQEQEPHVSTSIRQQDEYMYGTVVEVVKGDINKDEGGNGDTNIEVVVEVVANTGSGMSGGGVQQRKVSLNDMFSFGAISEQDRSKLYFDFLRDKGGKGNRDEMNENLTGDEMEMEMEMDESE